MRPVRFGGQLVIAEDLPAARRVLEDFKTTEEPSIQTPEIAQIVSTVDELLADASDLEAVEAELNRIVLRLGKACRHAWEIDKTPLAAGTVYEFNRVLYERAIKTTKRIADADEFEDTVELRNEFWRLYWGELPLIETPDVETAMVRFGSALQEWEQGKQPLNLNFDERAMAVEKACAKALQELNAGR